MAVLLAAHVLLGIYYSVTIPIWEAHDEIGHFEFVRYVATHASLPPPGTQLVDQNDESRQPPLYYILAALPVAFVPSGSDVEPHLNPHMDWPKGQGGANRVIHDVNAERWPYSGTVLAIHLARWVSVALGACALLFTFLAARTAFPSQPWVAWGATLILALWPQFRFSTAVVNNDILALTAASALAYVLVRSIMTPKPRAADMVAVAVVSGLALLSKNTTLAMLPVAALVLVGALLRSDRAMRGRLLACLGGGAAVAVGIVGWWYARNTAAGHGMFGGNYSLDVAQSMLSQLVTNAGAIRWSLAPAALQAGLFSLWAAFGWNNVALPLEMYGIAALWATLGVVGLLLWSLGRRQAQSAAVGVLLLIVVCTTGGFLLFTISGGRTDLPGRYLLPALPAVSILLATGWHTLLARPLLRWIGFPAMATALAALALVIPSRYITPRYALPVEITEDQAQEYTPVHVTWDGFAELVGYRADQAIDRDSTLHITLVWRALAQTDTDYSLAVQVFGPERQALGEVQTFPGRGALATTTWQPGSLFTQDVDVDIHGTNEVPELAKVELSFFDRLNVGKAVHVYDGESRELGSSLILTWVKVRGKGMEAPPAGPGDLWFGPDIRLARCEASLPGAAEAPALGVDLLWSAAAQPYDDYTVSLQLRDAQNGIASQVDTQPRSNTLPTSCWEPGEAIPDPYELDLPSDLSPGDYTLYLCVYHLDTLERLPVSHPQGPQMVNDEVALLTLSVAEDGEQQLRSLQSLTEVVEGDAG